MRILKFAVLGLGPILFYCTATLCQEAPKPVDVKPQVRDLLREANKDLDLVEDSHTRFRGLAQCAVLQAKSGDAEASKRSFQSARDMLKTFGEEAESIFARQLVPDYAKAKNVAEMKKRIETLPPPGPGYRGDESMAKGIVIRDCVLELAKAGNDKDALELAKTVTYYKPEKVRDEVLLEIALRHAEARDWKAVQNTVASISSADAKIKALAGITNAGVQNIAPGLPQSPGIALIQDKQGDRAAAQHTLDQALDLAKELKGNDNVQAWAAILCTQARFGDIVGAQKSLSMIPTTSPFYAVSLTAIAKAQAAAGQEKATLATIDKIALLPRKLEGMAHVVVGLAESGNMQGARAVADKAIELAKAAPGQQARRSLATLTRGQAIAKDFEGAFKTAAAISELDGSVYPSIAYWQGVHGDMKGALKTLEEHRDAQESAWVGNLEQIAYYQAQHGQAKEALAWVRQQSAPEVRAYGLMGVAKGLLEASSIAQSRP